MIASLMAWQKGLYIQVCCAQASRRVLLVLVVGKFDSCGMESRSRTKKETRRRTKRGLITARVLSEGRFRGCSTSIPYTVNCETCDGLVLPFISFLEL